MVTYITTGIKAASNAMPSSYGLIEIKLGSEQGIADGVRTLKALADKLDTTKMQKPSFLMVLTALGDFAYQRDDGVLVVPIASLGP